MSIPDFLYPYALFVIMPFWSGISHFQAHRLVMPDVVSRSAASLLHGSAWMILYVATFIVTLPVVWLYFENTAGWIVLSALILVAVASTANRLLVGLREYDASKPMIYRQASRQILLEAALAWNNAIESKRIPATENETKEHKLPTIYDLDVSQRREIISRFLAANPDHALLSMSLDTAKQHELFNAIGRINALRGFLIAGLAIVMMFVEINGIVELASAILLIPIFVYLFSVLNDGSAIVSTLASVSLLIVAVQPTLFARRHVLPYLVPMSISVWYGCVLWHYTDSYILSDTSWVRNGVGALIHELQSSTLFTLFGWTVGAETKASILQAFDWVARISNMTAAIPALLLHSILCIPALLQCRSDAARVTFAQEMRLPEY